ncbi:MAG: cell division protein FtsZ [Candidatus Aenigmatarchaeota archaeon]
MDTVIQNAFERTFDKEEKENKTPDEDYSPYQPEYNKEKVQEEFDVDVHQAKIVVVGAGGAGNNTVTTLHEMGVDGAETIAINTDAKHLSITKADKKILIGKDTTEGLGAGGYPKVGRKAAEESRRELKDEIEDADMVFITCGLGGGTGTGASPEIAKLAKDSGSIVIGTVTMPFKMEGTRILKAEEGLKKLRRVSDTVIVIENQKLLDYAGDLPVKQAFAVADELISTMIKGVTETITQPSLVNLDYADVKSIMHSGGVAAIGIGEADSSERAKEAIAKAMKHPLLEMDYSGADGAIVQIIGGEDLKLDEINEVGETISNQLDPEAQVIWGAKVMPEYSGNIQVISIITGVKSPYIVGPDRESAAQNEERGFSEELGIPVVESN